MWGDLEASRGAAKVPRLVKNPHFTHHGVKYLNATAEKTAPGVSGPEANEVSMSFL